MLCMSKSKTVEQLETELAQQENKLRSLRTRIKNEHTLTQKRVDGILAKILKACLGKGATLQIEHNLLNQKECDFLKLHYEKFTQITIKPNHEND